MVAPECCPRGRGRRLLCSWFRLRAGRALETTKTASSVAFRMSESRKPLGASRSSASPDAPEPSSPPGRRYRNRLPQSACRQSTPRFPEPTQTHVHGVGDAIQPSHPLASPSPPAPNHSQHQGLSNESILHMRWPKYWSFSFSIIPSKESPGLISFRMDWLDLLAVQGTLKSLLQHHSSPGPATQAELRPVKVALWSLRNAARVDAAAGEKA